MQPQHLVVPTSILRSRADKHGSTASPTTRQRNTPTSCALSNPITS